LFQRYDSNTTGGLEFSEMYEMLRSEAILASVRPVSASRFPWRDVFNAYDQNRDRKIDLAEFKNLLLNPELSLAAPSGIWATSAPVGLREFDANRDGYVDLNEVRAYSKAKGALRPQ
jgi:Ca2+-binding EF-hand superfamily protein